MPRVFFCAHCGKQTAVKIPRGGDGSMYVPVRHNLKGLDIYCPGIHEEAEEKQVHLKLKKRNNKAHN